MHKSDHQAGDGGPTAPSNTSLQRSGLQTLQTLNTALCLRRRIRPLREAKLIWKYWRDVKPFGSGNGNLQAHWSEAKQQALWQDGWPKVLEQHVDLLAGPPSTSHDSWTKQMCEDYAVTSDLSILMPTIMNIAVFWEGIPGGPLEIDQRCGRNYSLNFKSRRWKQ